MGTLLDYISWRGDLSFDQSPLNEVDSLILSLISYVDFKGIVSGEHHISPVSAQAAGNSFFAKNPDIGKVSLGIIVPKGILKLLLSFKECRRYRSLGVKAYINKIDLDLQMQFSAITFCMDNGDIVVAYRGTDDTIVGWKENFNMSFLDVIPAQAHALEYLQKAAGAAKGNIYITGHSKGGNLAVYSAIHCEESIKKRIKAVWNNDGPGFKDDWLSDPSYLDMKPKIRTLIPQSSVIGMLLQHAENYTVVKSRQVGLWQHDGLTWDVMGNAFTKVSDVTEDSKRIDKTLQTWISGLSLEQREEFCEALYKLISADNVLTLTDLFSFKKRIGVRHMKLDPEVKQVLWQTLSSLVKASAPFLPFNEKKLTRQ